MAAINPTFAEQRDGEVVLLQTRRHWWALARKAWLPLAIMAGLWAAVALAEDATLSTLIFGASLLLPGLALLYCIAEWRNDRIVITDQRIIRIERVILALRQQITQVGLESVQEINYAMPPGDPFARLFRYGTVYVITAGAQGNLELDMTPGPARFQKLLIEDRGLLDERRAQRHSDMVRQELDRYLAGEAPDAADAEAAKDMPPLPIRGTNGYLSARIEMSNGDIVYRKHISVWAQHTLLPLLIVLLALTGMLLCFAVVSPEARLATFSAAMVALLFGCVGYYWMDWDWRNDIYVISDDTITLVRKRPFFLQNIRDQILVERIDNVESSVAGLLPALFKYGEVSMSLVGADEPKRFERVPHPRAIQQEISRRQHNKALRRARYDAERQHQVLSEYLGAAGQAKSDTPSIAGSSPQPSNGGTVTAASSPDRNRPPRLPRKILAYPKPPQPSQRRRPPRLRANDAEA